MNVVCRILRVKNRFNQFWNKAVTYKNVVNMKSWEYFPDAVYTCGVR